MSNNILTQLRKCEFNFENEEKLLNHPYIVAATKNDLTKDQLKNFVCEQYYIQHFDEKSFQKMAEKSKTQDLVKCYKFFDMLAEGEKISQKLLLAMATSLGLTERALKSFECKMMAQAYPSFLSRCASHEPVSYIACACAVNFPTWGRMCARLRDALLSFQTHKSEDLEFLKFFATPIEGFDVMALECVEEEEKAYSEHLQNVVRLIQEAEVMFWDSVY